MKRFRLLFCTVLAVSMLALMFQGASAATVEEDLVTGFTEPAVAAKIGAAIIMRVDNPEAYVNNERVKIDKDNINVAPVEVGGIVYAPVDFFEAATGAAAIYAAGTDTYINGKLSAPLDAMVAGAGLYAFKDVDGLYVISGAPNLLDPVLDQDIIDTIANAMAYKWGNLFLGPNGFVTGLVIHPDNPDLIYCRTDVGGMYKWNAEREIWENLSDWLGVSNQNYYGVDGIAIDPGDENVVYMATGQYTNVAALVLKSTDQGKTWINTNFPSGTQFNGNGVARVGGENIAVDPNNSNIVYVGTTNRGLYRSTDAGATWAQVSAISSGNARVVAFDRYSDVVGGRTSTLYIGTYGNGMYYSNDGGDSFTRIASPASIKRIDISSERTVYAATGPYGENSAAIDDDTGIFRFKPGAAAWEDITPRKNQYQGAVAVSPIDPNYIISSEQKWTGNSYFISKDGGDSWEHAGMVQIFACMVFNPQKPEEIWSTDGGGVSRCKDAYADRLVWQREELGIEELCVVNVLSVPGGVKALVGVMDMGLMTSTDPEIKAYQANNPLSSETNSIDYCEEDPGMVMRLSLYQNARNPQNLSYASASFDGGNTWEVRSTLTGSVVNVAVGAEKQANGYPIVLSLRTTTPVPQRSTDFGLTWSAVSGLPSATGAAPYNNWWAVMNEALEADRVNGDVFYYCNTRVGSTGAGNVYVSTNGGANFSQTANVPLTNTTTSGSTATLKAAPGMEGVVWINSGNGLYASSDYGSSFTKLPNVQSTVVFAFGKAAPGNANPAVYVYGTVNNREGIFRSDDMGATWVRINDNSHKIGCIPTAMTGDPEVYGKLYIGTSGRGCFYGEFVSTDDVAPKVVIDQTSTTAEDGDYYAVRDGMYTITGVVSETATVKVSCAGAAAGATEADAAVDGFNRFTCDVNLAPGINELTVVATDLAGNVSAPASIFVNYVPGFVGITIYDYPHYTNLDSFVLSGKVNIACDVAINGAPAALEADNTFAVTLPLEMSENVFTVTAALGADAAEPKVVAVVRDTRAPMLALDEVNIVTNKAFHVITGSVDKPASVFIGNRACKTEDDLTFSYFALVDEGPNTFELTAVDLAGNISAPLTVTIDFVKDAVSYQREQLLYAEKIADGSLTFDGVLDEDMWELDYVPTILGTGANPDNFVQFGALWDSTYLYVGARVIDDFIHGNEEEPYQGDAIEVFVDSFNSKLRSYDVGARQFVFGADVINNVFGTDVSGADCMYTPTDDGYVMEIRILWSRLGNRSAGGMAPVEGLVMGFDLDNVDNDNGSGQRDTVVIWHGTMDDWQYTEAYGEIMLVATPVDFGALAAAIGAAEALDAGDYTGASWAAVEAALDEAYNVYGDANATQKRVDRAASELNAALGALVRDAAMITITGPAAVVSGTGATVSYTVSAAGIPAASGVELEFEVDGRYLSSNAFEALGGFSFFGDGNYGTPIYWRNVGDTWIGKATLLDLNALAGGGGGVGGSGIAAPGISGDVDLLSLVFNANEGMLGATEIKLNYVKISFINGPVAVYIAEDTVVTVFEQYYSPYDLNKDGVIDLNDLTFALQYMLAREGDANWEEAKAVDYTGDGKIEIDDLILILANYTVPYYS